MGYTHYFGFTGANKKRAAVLRWKTIQSDFKKMYGLMDWCNLIQFENNIPEKYRFDMIEVQFNGKDKEGHESFWLPRYFDDYGNKTVFCKTDRKPYDLPVICLLVLFKYYYGDSFYFQTDGSSEDFLICSTVLDRCLGLNFEINVNWDTGGGVVELTLMENKEG